MPLAVKYKNANNKDDIQKYFKQYKNICIDEKIANEEIQNINKTRFCVGCRRTYEVIILDFDKPMLLINPDN